jgi:hypothetical protein
VRKTDFNDSTDEYYFTNLPEAFVFNFSDKVEFGPTVFSLNKTVGVGLRNLYFKIRGITHNNLIGNLNGSYLIVDRFQNDSEENTTLTFTKPGALTFFINMSNHDVLNGTVEILARPSDPIPLSYDYNFTNLSEKYKDPFNRTAVATKPINETISVGDYELFTIEDFSHNISGSWTWAITDNDLQDGVIETSPNTTDGNRQLLIQTGQCSNANGPQVRNGWGNTVGLNISRFKTTVVTWEATLTCEGYGNAKGGLYLSTKSEGVERKLLFRDIAKCPAGTGALIRSHVTNITNLGGGRWQFEDISNGNDYSIGEAFEFDEDDVNIQLFADADCDRANPISGAEAVTKITNIQATGFGNEHRLDTTGSNSSLSFNLTTVKIMNSSGPIIRIRPRITEYTENNSDGAGNFFYYLSSNSGS